MDEFGCDYESKTVGEAINKYNIPDDWCAEFDAYDGSYPVVCMQVDQIRKNPAIMNIRLRVVGKDEYAGCIVFADRKTIAFKIDHISDLATR